MHFEGGQALADLVTDRGSPRAQKCRKFRIRESISNENMGYLSVAPRRPRHFFWSRKAPSDLVRTAVRVSSNGGQYGTALLLQCYRQLSSHGPNGLTATYYQPSVAPRPFVTRVCSDFFGRVNNENPQQQQSCLFVTCAFHLVTNHSWVSSKL